MSLDINRDGNLTDRLNTTNGLIIDSSRRNVKLKVAPNIDPFSLLAAIGSDGSIGRNTFRTTGINNLDLAIIKNFNLSRSQVFMLRAEIFNLFNRTHYGIPVRMLEFPSFGQAVNNSLSSRTIQFSARFNF